MALSFFKKKKLDEIADKTGAPVTPAHTDSSGNGKNGGGDKAPPGSDKGGDGFKRDERKARRWFEHAQSVNDYDFAIHCYIHGLEHDPDNMTAHEALYEVAMKRHVGGGKSATMSQKFKGMGKDPVHKMLHAERLWALNPKDTGLMITVMQRAAEANKVEPDLNLGELAYWIGDMILKQHVPIKPLSKSTLLQVRDLFAEVRAFDKAVEACKMVLAMDSSNTLLLQELKNLEAERTIESGYSGTASGTGTFRDSVLDVDKQRALEHDDAISKTESVVDQVIARRRAEFDEMPEDTDRAKKLVEALLQKESDTTDEEAMKLLKDAWDRTGQYGFKEWIGSVRIKQFNRQLRVLKPAAAASPEGSEDRKVYFDIMNKKLAFELEEFAERVHNLPTHMGYKFELGKRFFQTKKIDEAIGLFQQSKGDPKWRAVSHEFLGKSYLMQGWLDEAIQTFQGGLDANPDEKLELELQFLKMDVLEKSAVKNRNLEQAREAQKLASEIMQVSYQYKDIRTHMDRLRKLTEELEKEKKG